MPEFITPRDEFETCDLFEAFTFGRGLPETEGPRPWIIPEQYISILNKMGILNTLFRRWAQTTWGWNSWSKHFEGQTPMQELQLRYPELRDGTQSVFVHFVKRKNALYIEPFIYDEKKMGMPLCLYRLSPEMRESNSALVEQRLDYLVADAITIKNSKQGIQFHRPATIEECIEIFWNNAVYRLIDHSGIPVNPIDREKLAHQMKSGMELYFRLQNGVYDYLNIDVLFEGLWNVIGMYIPNFPSHQKIMDEDEEKNITKRGVSPRHLEMYYRFGIEFDEQILFPFDHFFGGAEIVWTDKMNIAQILLITCDLLPKLKKMSLSIGLRHSKAKLSMISPSILDIAHLWHAPSTCFRLKGNVYNYFKNL